MKDLDVCQSYGTYAAASVFGDSARQMREEIERRKRVTSDEWAAFDVKKIRVGVSQCAMYPLGAGRAVRAGAWAATAFEPSTSTTLACATSGRPTSTPGIAS